MGAYFGRALKWEKKPQQMKNKTCLRTVCAVLIHVSVRLSSPIWLNGVMNNVFLGKISTVACGGGYFVVSVASLVYMLAEFAVPARASMNAAPV